jgi:hypothetical protein
MAEHDLSSILKPKAPALQDEPPEAVSEAPAPVAAILVPEPTPTKRLWELLGRERLAPKSRWDAQIRYRQLVKRAKGQPPAAVVKALHDELAWAYPRLGGPGRPSTPDSAPTDPDRIEWEVAALMIERVCVQLEAAANTSEAWREAIHADVEGRTL